jgi:hypothetical protein
MLKYIRIEGGGELPDIRHLKPFKAIVIIEEEVLEEWQARTSTWLVDSGCLYMMAWGLNCSSWDDSVDVANCEQWNFGDIPDEAFVMTTWHESEPMDEVFFFARHAAFHSTVSIENVLILHIGSKDKEAVFEKMFRDAPPY